VLCLLTPASSILNFQKVHHHFQLSFYAQHPPPTDAVTTHRLALEVKDGAVYFMHGGRRFTDRILAAKVQAINQRDAVISI
jgi:hypothetical protein